MRQIAERAGLALGGIYNHFASKEAIFSELIIDTASLPANPADLLKTPADDMESFVRTAAQAMVNELGKRPDFIKLMLIEMLNSTGAICRIS